jgi:GGDEF domain-containing protein
MRELFGIQQPAEKTVLRFDLPGFGAINNNHDYDRGDAIFSALATVVSDQFPDAKLVRESGGSLLVVLDAPPSSKELAPKVLAVNKVLFEAFSNLIEDERSMAEWENEKERRIVELQARIGEEPHLRAVLNRWQAMDFSFIFVEQQTVTISPDTKLAAWARTLDTKPAEEMGWKRVT